MTGFPTLCHVGATEVQLGGERVVSVTMQGHVGDGVPASLAEWLSMVQLQVRCFLAACATLVDIRTTCAVTLVDGSAHRRRNVPALRAIEPRIVPRRAPFDRQRRGNALAVALAFDD